MAEETKISAIYEIRIEQGPALRELEQTKKRLDENAFAKSKLAKETKALLAEQQRLEATIRKEGDATGTLGRQLAVLTQYQEENNRKVTEADALHARLSGVYREQRNDVSGLTEANLRFRDKMADANLEALKQSGILGQISAQERTLKTELEGVNAGIEKNQSSIAELNVAWKKGAISEEEYRRQLDAVNAELASGQAANAKLSKELEGVTAKSNKLEEELRQLNAEFKAGKISQEQYQKGLKDIDNSTKSLGASFDKFVQGQGAELKSTLSSVALQYVGVGAAIYGVQRVLGSTIDTIVEFDQQIANVRALGGDFARDIDLLGDAALRMGPKFAIAPTKALEAVEALAKAGVESGEILAGALEGTLALSAAGSIEDVGVAAEIASSTMNQFGLQGEDVAHIADLLAAGANKAAGEVTDFGAALKFIGPVAAANNVSLEETVGSIAAFAQSGIVGEQAGTSLRGVLAALTSPSKAASAELKNLGIVAEDGSNKLFDAQGNFKGLANLAGTLQEATAGLTDEQKSYSLGLIFGNQQLTAANVLVKEGYKGISDYTEAVNESGFANDVAAGKLDSLSGEFGKASAAWDAFVLSIDKGNGIISRGLRAATGALTQFLSIVSGNNEFANFQDDLDSIAEKSGLGTSGLGDTKPVKAARDEVGQLLKQVNDLSNGVSTTTDEFGKLKAVKLEPGDELVEYDAIFERITAKIEETRKAASDGLIDPEIAAGKIGALELLITDRLNPALDKQIALSDKAAVSAEKMASAEGKQAGAVTTVAQKRELLNVQLEQAKAAKDALSESDTEGIALAQREIDTIDAQIKALDNKASGTKKVSEAEKQRIALLADLTKAEEGRARAAAIQAEAQVQRATEPVAEVERQKEKATTERDTRIVQAQGDTEELLRIEADYQARLSEIKEEAIGQPQAQAQAAVIVDSRARIEAAGGDKELLARIETETQEQLRDIRNKFGAEQTEQEDDIASMLLEKRAEGSEQRLAALLKEQDAERKAFRGNSEELKALYAKQTAERAPLLRAEEDEVIRVLTENAEKEFALLDAQGISTIELQDQLGKTIAEVKAKYREQELTDEEAQTIALQDIHRQRQEETLGTIAGFLGQAQAISDLAFDGRIAKIDEENQALKDQIEGTSNDQLKASLERDLKANEQEKKRLEDRKKAFKAFAIGAALIETYLAANKAYTSQLVAGDPTSLPRAIAAGVQAVVAGLINVAQIKGFVKGGAMDGEVNGVVKPSWGLPIRRSNGDNVLVRTRGGGAVTLQNEEMVLSRKSRAKMEGVFGPRIWGALGVPGFAGKSDDVARDFRMGNISGFADGGTLNAGIAALNASAPRPEPSDLIAARLVSAMEKFAATPVVASWSEGQAVGRKIEFQETASAA